MILFPEGTTSNNTHICEFKKGAFCALANVIPVGLKYHMSGIDWTTGCMNDIDVLVFRFCTLDKDKIDVSIYPPFIPNEFLFENHMDKITQEDNEKQQYNKALIYSWAVRDLLSVNENLPKCDQTYEEKKQLWKEVGIVEY